MQFLISPRFILILFGGLFLRFTAGSAPSWDTLDARPLPEWYDQAKFGIFLHWGVFSVPSFGSEWFWSYWRSYGKDEFRAFVNSTERPGFSYVEYAHRFKAEFYQPDDWADIFASSGAQYVVLTSKHHEGFCMWNSTSVPTTWNWNVMDVGPKRDLLGDLSVAVKKTKSPFTNNNLKFGLYHSLYEWYNPLYIADKNTGFQSQTFVDMKTMAELFDLVNRYEPELIWSDGEWEAPSSYWKATEFLEWYATNSSVANTAVWNDRWGTDTLCKHGGFLTCTDRYDPGKFVAKKWENAFTIDKTSWGLNRNASYSDYMTVKELIHTIVHVVAFNGNVLLNVGPAADGTIHPIFVDRLLGIGEWMKVNGEAIYGTVPWEVCQNETDVYYTKKEDVLFAIVTKWPEDNQLDLACPLATSETTVRMLGLESKPDTETSTVSSMQRSLRMQESKQGGITVIFPSLTPDVVPCQHAWVLEVRNIGNI